MMVLAPFLAILSYTHCHSHRLNLVIAKSCCVHGVLQMFLVK